jgi:hypothetical protein
MTMRTTKSTVTFVRPFRLGPFGEQFPAGRYSIETDEEVLDGCIFPLTCQEQLRCSSLRIKAAPVSRNLL